MKKQHLTQGLAMVLAAFIAFGGLTAAPCLQAQEAELSPPEQVFAPRKPRGEGEHWGKPGPRPGRGREHGERAMRHVKEWIEQLKTENPEEYEKLMKLREKDPEAFRQALHTRLRDKMGDRIRQMHEASEGETIELAERYHAAETAEEKAEVKEQLTAAVKKAFDERIATQKEMLKRMEEKLTEFRERMEKRKAKRDEICAERIEQLTRDPALKW
jgi:hypothetical protein